MDNIKPEVGLYKDFHAQIVHLGFLLCKIKNPKCQECPLSDICKYENYHIFS
jgi:endonuclease-3 related protein